mmetsp:Transcript_11209/g.24271  ORF Transcript_11209/g.24271 Transcript_11209/m.24271 type:complete len:234 (-) Transcript_11209:745-1446(-)
MPFLYIFREHVLPYNPSHIDCYILRHQISKLFEQIYEIELFLYSHNMNPQGTLEHLSDDKRHGAVTLYRVIKRQRKCRKETDRTGRRNGAKPVVVFPGSEYGESSPVRSNEHRVVFAGAVMLCVRCVGAIDVILCDMSLFRHPIGVSQGESIEVRHSAERIRVFRALTASAGPSMRLGRPPISSSVHSGCRCRVCRFHDSKLIGQKASIGSFGGETILSEERQLPPREVGKRR